MATSNLFTNAPYSCLDIGAIYTLLKNRNIHPLHIPRENRLVLKSNRQTFAVACISDLAKKEVKLLVLKLISIRRNAYGWCRNSHTTNSFCLIGFRLQNRDDTPVLLHSAPMNSVQMNRNHSPFRTTHLVASISRKTLLVDTANAILVECVEHIFTVHLICAGRSSVHLSPRQTSLKNRI